MNENFAKFITEKRKQAGLTQNDVASKLFVTPSTVSKWERGKCSPDVSLILEICRLYKITEHEYLTACEDKSQRIEKQQAKNFRTIAGIYDWSFYIGYAVALLACFIVNLATQKTLSWFLIVFASLALAFSITNLFKFIKCKYKFEIIASISTFLTFLLVFVINAVSYSNWWYFDQALPVLAICFGCAWTIYLTFRYLPTNIWFKTSILSIVIAGFGIGLGAIVTILINNEPFSTFSSALKLNFRPENIGGTIAFIALCTYLIVSLILGTIYTIRKKKV